MQILYNGEPREIHEPSTVADLLADLKLTPKHVAVEVNRQLVPRADHSQPLAPGDEVEVVTLVGGG